MEITTSEDYICLQPKTSHGNIDLFFNTETTEINNNPMELKTHKIYWHKQGIKIDLESWNESEDTKSISIKRPQIAGVCTPGPKAEAPFEVTMLESVFMFDREGESTVYAIKISSRSATWIVIKNIKEIISLITTIKSTTNILSRLRIKELASIAPEKQEERSSLVKLILTTALNNESLQSLTQHFVLTNAIPLTESEEAEIERDLYSFIPSNKGLFLVEYQGWLKGWTCGLFQLHKDILTRTSVRTGEVTESINTKQVIITIENNILKVQKDKKTRLFYSNDKRTLKTLRDWFFSSPINWTKSE
ncbi:hypothetical protein NEOKW01_1851 [Nematocida sp. AWRm80]|nr:hypothetical protein NEOKW01_1851 [Nematocida sp. AWRm80]